MSADPIPAAATRVRISFPRPEDHLLHVRVRTPDLEAGEHEFLMPVWTPGSYMVREFSRHVEGMAARSADGADLCCTKVRKNRWRVDLDRPGSVELTYRVYCRDLTVRTNHVDERRAYWNGAAAYVVAAARVEAPLAIEVDAPAGWTAHCALDERDGVFLARDLDHAVDSPFVVGPLPVERFEACGREHRVVFDGVGADERRRLTEDTQRIVEAAATLFGGELPYERYLMVLFADHVGSGGLEHADSSVLHVRRGSLRRKKERLRVLDLIAHEHFHAWNVKRIRPADLARFAWDDEQYTRDLWLAEGFTTYYQEVVPYLAGLFGRQLFLDRLAENAHVVQQVPGRALQSLSESSFDAWIKLYRPDENTRNTTVSYYGKGALVALCLDLRIQAASGGAAGLDDVMRGLYRHYLEHGPGQPRALVLELCEGAAGARLGDEFGAWIDGREDPPLEQLLEPFGLALELPDGPLQATLDVRCDLQGGRIEVSGVDRGGAGDALGLSPGDELVAIDGERVLAGDFEKRLHEECEPGQEVELLVFRRGLATTLRGRLGAHATGVARMRETGEGRLVFRARADG
ncbi:MAG: peptidase M61 [Planctomycetota bacterium]